MPLCPRLQTEQRSEILVSVWQNETRSLTPHCIWVTSKPDVVWQLCTKICQFPNDFRVSSALASAEAKSSRCV